MKKVLTGNQAAAYGAILSDVDVVSAYPISPQTTIIEELAEMQASGLADLELIRVESEHSVMSACIGASMGGVRVFTATAGQGLLYMHEMLHYAAGARTPIVMVNVNRPPAPPWNMWSDQTDSISQRDTGWIQLYCEGSQEVLDTTIMAFKIAESVKLPVMIIEDAFFLSHTSEPVDIPEKRDVESFLPPFDPEDMWLNPDNPRSFGAPGTGDVYMEFRWHIQRDMERAKAVCSGVEEEFGTIFGRRYPVVEEYRCEDAEIIIVCSGAVASTAREAIDSLRDKGERVGLTKIKALRPFPRKMVSEALKNRQKVAIIDRNFSPGASGVWCQEIRSAIYDLPEKERPLIYGYVVGLGGRDITIDTIKNVFELTQRSEQPDDIDIWIGVKYV